jgi:protoporphyrin/coproporphyrin ferrochelatase
LIEVQMKYDALLLVSFGGPESREQVMPFLRNVLRGRNVPEERMLEVAEHYYHFGGRSPINDQNRALIAALKQELAEHGPDLPIYWGNRNWHPFLPDALRQMKSDGIQRALAFVTSAYSSYSGCRQYRENIAAAQEEVGDGAPQVDKLRVFYNHPGFIAANIDCVQAALAKLPPDLRERAHIVYTAHSIPTSVAATSNYVRQLEETRRLISSGLNHTSNVMVFQSRSGPPSQPWLGPDVMDYLREVKHNNLHPAVVIAPIGFISDHMEVLYDLDTEAHKLCHELGLPMVRATTVGTHPRFVSMVRELITERISEAPEKSAVGLFPASHDVCAADCCPAPRSPTTTAKG